MNTITPQELEQKRADGKEVTLIDVRSPIEFKSQHIPFAKNIPLDTISEETCGQIDCEGGTTYVVCRSGSRAEKACERLAEFGCDNITSVDGGTEAWLHTGLPVVESKQAPISLERQVRIAAGILVITGIALAHFIHVGFLGLSAFVGLGLIFAGVTDTCGMAILLTKLPWNR